jgi:septum formation protein
MTVVVLASASTARRAMLEAAGVAVEMMPARVDEAGIKASLAAEGAPTAAAAEALAEVKAMRISRRYPGRLVLGADQMLECSGAWFDKPADRPAAAAQLEALSGREHRLVSCVVAALDGSRIWHHTDEAVLRMRQLSAGFIAWYLDAVGDEALMTVGVYRVEGLGAQLFSRIAGDHFTIQGMPLLPVLGFLRERGELRA